MAFYRFILDGKGIYEMVDKFCPKDDPRRQFKPDGSWLAKKGNDFPGAISFWTEQGLRKYISSGLMTWHLHVVEGKVTVLVIDKPENILYEDEYQIITGPDSAAKGKTVPVEELVKSFLVTNF